MEVAGHAHILSCSPLGVSTPLFDGLWAHREPKSRPDRALSSTEMGRARCLMPESACGWAWTSLVRGTPHTAGQPWRDGACLPRGVPRTRGRFEADCFFRVVSGV